MKNFSTLKKYAELAWSAYGDFGDKNPSFLAVNNFNKEYENCYVVEYGGFSATLYKSKSGENIIAVRGTNFDDVGLVDDVVNDFLLATIGTNWQNSDLQNFYNDCVSAGLLSSTDKLTVVGHSLGGYLAQIFTLKNPEVINHTYTFNAPGLLGMNGTILNLLGLENIHSSKVSDIIAKDGINFTNAAGLNVGEEIKISGDSHSIKDMTEILYFYDLAIKKDSNENQITNYLSGFYKNNSTIFKSNSVVNIASKTLKEFNNIIGLSNTDINSIIDTCIVLENKNFHLNLLTPNSSITSIFSSSKLSTPALYALVNLNPFIVSGINSNAYDEIEKFKDEYSSEYIKDKVKMFESALDSKKNLGIYFNDIETGITIDQTTDFNGYFDEYHFGTNSNDIIRVKDSKSGDNKIYALAGDDNIIASNGNNYIEAGSGNDIINLSSLSKYSKNIVYGDTKDSKSDDENSNDIIIGGKGQDSMFGGSGFDSYYAGDKDIITDDTDGKGKVIFNSTTLTGGTYDKEKSCYVSGDIEYHLNGNTLIVKQGKDSLTINNFNKDLRKTKGYDYLGIDLLDQDEISVSISDNSSAEGNTPNQLMDFTISVNGEIPKGEFAIINVGGKEYLLGNPSSENIKKYNLDLSKYEKSLTHTHTWSGNETPNEDIEFEVSGSVVLTSDGLKVKDIISGKGVIIDDDNDDEDVEDIDPIIIDLNRNGITSSTLNNTTYFDHDNNSFKEVSSWLDSGDAFLALDKNGNGTIDNGNELFGNQTIANTKFNKHPNSKATHGFEALKAYDLNNDNVIDEKDEIYDKLLLWKDDNKNAITDNGELIKLKDSGITSIDLNYKEINIDESGNTIKQTSKVTFEDGSTAIANDVWFRVNLNKTKEKILDEMISDTLKDINTTSNSIEILSGEIESLKGIPENSSDETLKSIEIKDKELSTLKSSLHSHNEKLNSLLSIKSLPQVKGFGNLSSLREAMANNPKLATMVSLYTKLDDKSKKESIDDIIYEWAKVSDIDEKDMRGGVTSRVMKVYEKLSGKPFLWKGYNSNANSYLTPVINEKFSKFKDYAYANIELQTSYDKNFINTTLRYGLNSSKLEYDFSNINEHILSLYEKKEYKKVVEFSTLIQNATLYLPSYQASLKQNYKAISNKDAYLLGLCLNTFILGTDSSDTLIGNSEDNIIEGFGGDDVLEGRGGNDIYKFTQNFGNDRIFDLKGDNKILFTKEISKDSISFKREFADLIIYVKQDNTINSITVNGFFCLENEYGDGALSIEFEDDEIWDKRTIDLKTPMVGTSGDDKFYLTNSSDTINLGDGDDTIYAKKGDDVVFAGSGNDTIYGGLGNDIIMGEDGDDTLYGESGNDTINGGSGNDTIYSGTGDDTLIGGSGDDTLQGGSGDDTYLFNGREFGNDTIINLKSNLDERDTIEFNDLKLSDLEFSREFDGTDITNNLIIKVKPSFFEILSNDKNQSSIKVVDFFSETGINDRYKVDIVKAKDKTLSSSDIEKLTLKPTIKDDIIKANSKEINSSFGDDIIKADINGSIINAGAGNDILISSNGSDTLKGGIGDDTYIYTKGKDTIIDALGSDTLVLNTSLDNTEMFKLNSDLVINFKDNKDNQIIIKNHFLNIFGTHNQIESFKFKNQTLKANELSFTDISNRPSVEINLIVGDNYFGINLGIDKDDTSIDIDKIAKQFNEDRQMSVNSITKDSKNTQSFILQDTQDFIDKNTINKVIEELNSYSSNNGISLNNIENFKNNPDIVQIYSSGWGK